MTHRSASPRRAVLRAWLLPMIALAAVWGAVYLDLISPSILLDFLAWWPVWMLIALVTFMVRGRRIGRVRVSGMMPLVTLIVFGLFVFGHLAGWPTMPSASVRLAGPGQGSVATAAMSARVTGGLVVTSGGSGFLYEVEPIRRGGETAMPDATEQIQGANMSIQLVPKADPGLYVFGGWMLDLDRAPTWSLSLSGDMDADLGDLRLTALQIDGKGKVRLGHIDDSAPVTVSGDFDVTVDPGTPVRVVGVAEVPADWIQTSDGWESPTSGNGWVFSVAEDSILTLREG
jgi:hypothetical protein